MALYCLRFAAVNTPGESEASTPKPFPAPIFRMAATLAAMLSWTYPLPSGVKLRV